MKRIATFVAATCAACAPAAELVAPEFGFATNRVEAGSVQVQADCILAADGSCIHKSGGGEWSVPLSYLPQHWPVSFAVQEGTLSFCTGAAEGEYESPCDLPGDIKAKALIWVDAQESSKIVQEDGAVAKWYDRRETNIESPSYARAETYHGYTNESPVVATVADGKSCVYFGDLGSGRAMKFVNPDGSDCDDHYSANMAVRQVFAVVNISNSHGHVFGSFGNTASPFRVGDDTSAADSLKKHYFYSSREGNGQNVNEIMIHGRAYLNGERIDPTQHVVEKGLQLIEAEARILTGNTLVSGLFAGGSAKKSGGGYLCEAIAFTNRLDEAQRLQVEEYLLAKWLPGKGRHLKKVALASGTKLSVGVAEGEVAKTRISLSGTGVAEKTGGGELRIGNTTSDEGAEWNVKEGSLTLCAFAPVKVETGKRVTVSNPVTGPLIVTAPASTADSFVKSGKERLVVNGVPAGAKRISVEGGTLTVRSPGTDAVAPESAYEVPVRNGSFEDYAQVLAEKRPDGSRVEALLDMPGYGWARAEGTVYVYDYDGWNTGTAGVLKNTRTAFNFTARPPDGKCVLMMRSINGGKSTVRSDAIVLTETGDYDLTFKMSGRNSSSYVGGNLRIRLVEAGNTQKVHGPEHRVRYMYWDGYVEHRLKFPAIPAGSYLIEFFLAANSFCAQIDDVRLYKVPSERLAASRWKVPGGDFETKDDTVGKAAICELSSGYAHEAWTLVQPESWGNSLPAVGLTTLAVTNTYSTRRGLLYNNSREPFGGSFQLCMLGNGASARTSVKPPAGTYRLESFISRFGPYGVYPKVDVSVTKTDGTEIDLGRLEPVNKMMKRQGWPNSFTVDGSETVSLKFMVSGLQDRVDHLAAGVLIDDVELVTATDLELFANGDCSGANGDYRLKAINATEFGGLGGKVQTRSDTENPGVFGGEMIDGRKMIVIGNISCIYEDVALPFAGRYRLSFYTHSRTSKTGIYGPNPLEVRLIYGGKTNVLGRVDTYSTDWVQRIYEFTVPSAGTYRVELKGLTNPLNANAQYEAHVDSISLKQVHEERDLTAPFDRETCIDVAQGARLETDFTGTNVIRRMKLGEVALGGVVDVSDYPEYLSGRGVFHVVPHGSVMVLR